MTKLLLILGLLAALGGVRAQDMPLSEILIEEAPWELMAEGYEFTDAPCVDEEGNFYFTDVGKGTTINKISTSGNLSIHLSDLPRISGLKFGPDKKFYAATQHPKKQIIRFEEGAKFTVLADDVQPNDLAVTAKGGVYFTETGKSQVTYISPQGVMSKVAGEVPKPNGLTLSVDQGTLVVSDFGGTNAWAFRVHPDGKLSGAERYITLLAPHGQSASAGDGMICDTAGRYYVATAMGIQVFDPTGRACGVIAKPQPKFLSNMALAGPNLEYLYVTCSDRIYRRKTKARGKLPFMGPPK